MLIQESEESKNKLRRLADAVNTREDVIKAYQEIVYSDESVIYTEIFASIVSNAMRNGDTKLWKLAVKDNPELVKTSYFLHGL